MSSEESDTEDINQLTINEHYAKAYAYQKEIEEIGQLKNIYGSDAESNTHSEDSEDLETEDDEGDELTPGVDAAILRLLAKIKRKDPEIYEKDKAVFDEEKQRSGNLTLSSKIQRDKYKAITLRQHKLAAELGPVSRSPSPPHPTHVQEQQQLRHETISAFHHAVDGDDDLLVPREKTKDELEREEEEYREFLEREVGDSLKGLIEVDTDQTGVLEEIEDLPKDAGSKKSKKDERTRARNKERDDQGFLMNYILNRGWIDHNSKRLPTYTEVTSIKNSAGKRNPEQEINGPESAEGDTNAAGVNEDLDAEDEFNDISDVFESSYNFRFEEPDAVAIMRHPRDIASTVRRPDTTRKEARERRKVRKEEEMLKKKEEVKRLKALKMKALKAKLERIGREGGWEDIEENQAFEALDLDGNWDPEAHDEKMANLYQMDNDDDQDGVKPSWDDDIDIDDIMPPHNADKERPSKKKKSKKKRDSAVDQDVGIDVDAMDADNPRSHNYEEEEEWDGTEEMRKRKLDEYMDELYEMEFNDMAGGMPTRFKYTMCATDSYGLSAEEIFMADDGDLNQYIGIKKYAPYRKGGTWDSKRSERLKDLRQKLGERHGQFTEDCEAQPAKKRKGKKERQRLKDSAATEAEDGGKPPPKKRRRKKVDADLLEADGEDAVAKGEPVDSTVTKEDRQREDEDWR